MNEATQMEMAPLPKTLGGLVAYVTIDGTRKAAEFYKVAFGAEEKYCVPPDDKGRSMHLHLYINGSSLMMSDPYPEYGHPFKGHEGFALQLVVEDIDFWWERAIKAGAEVVMPVEKMFWGDRYGQLRDPFGIIWGLNETPA
jgi:PhnB protein